jgi:hypothetical protein
LPSARVKTAAAEAELAGKLQQHRQMPALKSGGTDDALLPPIEFFEEQEDRTWLE